MKTTIKRLILIALCMMMVFSLCCCKKTPSNDSVNSTTSNPVINIDDDTDISSEGISSDDTTSEDTESAVNSDTDKDNTTSSNNSVIGPVTSSNPNDIASGNNSDGNTVIENTGDDTPTTSTTTNTENGHTITATYEWHPGLPDTNVSYPITVLVDNAPVNASQITFTSSVNGVSFAGNVVTIPYSVRSAGNTITVTAKHSSGVKCDINIPCFKYTQTFNDDFNGTTLDRTKWSEHSSLTTTPPSDAASYQVIDRAKSVKDCFEVKDGKLNMLIKDQPCYDTTNKIKYLYSECCLDTRGNFMQTYGLFQANIACAKFGGINTAFWLLPNGSYSTQYTNFMTEDPNWGLAEIDILEASVAFGSKDRKTFCISEHFYNYNDNYDHKQQSKYYKVNDTITNFHTYSCVWTADALYYYVDSDLIRSTTGLQAKSAGGKSVSRAYMIIDVALYLDNAWVGKRDFTKSDLPIAGTVDWVRAYKFK